VVSALVLAGMLAVAALAWIAGAAKADASGSGGSAPSAVYHNLTAVIVRPGESLWTIAAQAEPNADPRSVIQEIIDLNALGATSIQPGQRLWVPRG
jgi:LysM domain-containing protein